MDKQIQVENLLFFRNTVSLNDSDVRYQIFTPRFQWDWYDAGLGYQSSRFEERSAGIQIPDDARYVRLTVWGKVDTKTLTQLTQTRLIEIPV